MSGRDGPVDLVVAAWPDPDGAGQALRELRQAKREHLIGILDVATLVIDGEGKLRIRDTKDMGVGEGAVIGGVLGAALGLITGGLGWLLVGGGVIGALAARARDGGLPDARLRELGERMTPNSSAIVAVIEHRWVAALEREIADRGAEVLTEVIGEDLAAQLGRGSAVAYSAAEVEGDVVATRTTQPTTAGASADRTDAGGR